MPETADRQLAREYELIYILRPNTGPSEARKVSDRISDIVDKRGAKLTLVDNWGKRKLAYPIQKHTRGVFVFVKFVGLNDVVAELERNLRNLDDVMRWQTVRNEAVLDLDALEVDPDEVQFKEIEVSEEEDHEPSFEESLGMRSRERERPSEDSRGERSGESSAEGEAKAKPAAKAAGEGAEAEATDETKPEAEATDETKPEAKAAGETKPEGEAAGETKPEAESADEKKPAAKSSDEEE